MWNVCLVSFANILGQVLATLNLRKESLKDDGVVS